MAKEKAKVGDIVNGWEILEITSRRSGNQNISYARIRSTLGDKTEKEDRLTKLTLRQIGWPDRRRPDNVSRNTTHNASRTRLYRIWAGMKNRCFNTKQLSYEDYGGRGVSVCDEWLDFSNFNAWALTHGYSEELTLDRKDVDGNYCPENCQWSDWHTQVEHRRISKKIDITAFGETKSIYQWINDDRCNLSIATLAYRIKSGWNPEDAITKPSERKKKQSLESWLQEKYPDVLSEYVSQ